MVQKLCSLCAKAGCCRRCSLWGGAACGLQALHFEVHHKPEAKTGEAWRRQFQRMWDLEQLRALRKSFPADDDTLH